MKVFIAIAFFAAAAASVIASPGIGYNTYGINAGPQLVAGVRSLSPIATSYVSPVATRVVAPIGAQYVTGVRTIQPVATRLISPVATSYVSRPVIAGVRTISPVVSAPLVSNVVAPSLYSNYGSGLYGSGYIAKKV